MVHSHIREHAALGRDGLGCDGNSVYFNGIVHTLISLSYQRSPSHPIPAQRVCDRHTHDDDDS